jgi:hypothetical protein
MVGKRRDTPARMRSGITIKERFKGSASFRAES